jgi:hypothetical protein
MSSLRAARNESVARLPASSLKTEQAAASLYDQSVARLLAEHYHSSEAIAYSCNAYFLFVSGRGTKYVFESMMRASWPLKSTWPID